MLRIGDLDRWFGMSGTHFFLDLFRSHVIEYDVWVINADKHTVSYSVNDKLWQASGKALAGGCILL
jgi:hypothetical protein